MADQSFDVGAFIAHHRLPASYAGLATNYFLPLAEWIEAKRRTRGKPGLIIGVNGAQGTGKSTLCNFLAQALSAQFERTVAELSIDDIYLTRHEREKLAHDVHPLLMTRGVPGTHDVNLGIETLDSVASLGDGMTMPVPRFDKARDDRCPQDDWPTVTGPVDVVLFEGWCVGSTAAAEDTLQEPVNALEAGDDALGTWRRYVNAQLAEAYPPLFNRLDALVLLAAPGFDSVLRWRTEQEQKLRDRVGSDGTRVLTDAQVARFVHHFERITRSNFRDLPAAADVVIQLDESHRVDHMAFDGQVFRGHSHSSDHDATNRSEKNK